MTVEEIKQTYSMRSIVERYGIKVKRDGMCSCPFHGADNNPSMKIYEDSFYCFTCNAHGDIFSFVQKMDNCDFKKAFYSLGGEYGNQTKASRTALYRLEMARKQHEKEKRKIQEKIQNNNMMIHATRELYQRCNPQSEEWWYYYDLYHKALIEDERIMEEVRN